MEKQTPEHEIYEEQLDQHLKNDPNASFGKCRNCKSEIRRKMRRCPYCGILNPTVTVKEIFITMFFIIAVFAIATPFIN
jgi:hypothetical protein